MQQLDLFTPDRPPLTHVMLPNMSHACGHDILEPDDDRSTFGTRWPEVTCPWCHALGARWYRWACAVMQGLDPVTGERRSTDPERALLAGTSDQ